MLSTPIAPWSFMIDYFIETPPFFDNIPMVPSPPLTSDRFKMMVPSFSTTIQGTRIYGLLCAAIETLH